MKFLLDQDVYIATARWLRDRGHDVVSAAQIGLSQAADEDLLKAAQEQGRIFVTRDRDFGHLVFVKAIGTGVVYLRMSPSTQNAVHDALDRILQTYSEDELRKAFIVIGPDGYRRRRFQH